MRAIFAAELRALGDDLVDMSRRVERAITDAGVALLTSDLALAEATIAHDVAIDDLERHLDERSVLLLAQQQPVATDLRIVVSALRMSASLERMGDLARHVAEITRRCYPASALPPEVRPTFVAMDEAAVRVANRITTLLVTHDLDLAQAIERDDDLLDGLHQQSFAAQLTDSWSGTPQQTVDVTLLSRFYERFGDHAVSIARRIVYLVTGEFGPDDPALGR